MGGSFWGDRAIEDPTAQHREQHVAMIPSENDYGLVVAFPLNDLMSVAHAG